MPIIRTKVALFYHGESENTGIAASHPYGELVHPTITSNALDNGEIGTGMIGEVGIDLITDTIATSDLAKVMKDNPGLSSHILDWALSRQLQPFTNWENI